MRDRAKRASLLWVAATLFIGVWCVGLGGCTAPQQTVSCTPIACADVAKSCGLIADQCGGNLFCGNCDAPSACGLSTNTCGCDSDPTICDGKCGQLIDNCGQPVTCASCGDGLNCGGAGPNVCGSAVCTPATCADSAKDCGIIADGCGALLDCGSCGGAQSCGGGGVANVCGCKATTCGALGKDCGSVSDGCGGTLDCGTCDADKSCGGGGVANVCGSDVAKGTAILTWTMPTQRADGTPLDASEIGGCRVYYGTAPLGYGPPVDVGLAQSHTLAGLSSGTTYYFAVTVYDTAGNESVFTNEGTKSIP